ncbi:hypothetical protein BYT27DRAFT_7108615 [Phlegmacium glaucopus]|nr:hypothetical protein BYT27DRAFT_7108615 [Phlegmacium glaucopus]
MTAGSKLLSTLTVTTIGLTCKAFLNSGLCSIQVNGIQTLKDALKNQKRNSGQGIITVSNHISTLDDPVIWGMLPAQYYLSSMTTRWALGASDIMFTNPVFSTFFSLGQTIETIRGKGIYQAAVDIAIQKVNLGGWVHIFGEGKVNQPDTYLKTDQGHICLPRFKWGVGRILMEAKVLPVVIPMWITGFDQLMPEGRTFPYNYLPRIGARLSVTFGGPIAANELLEALRPSASHSNASHSNASRESSALTGPSADTPNTTLTRQRVTAFIHHEVERLGVSTGV